MWNKIKNQKKTFLCWIGVRQLYTNIVSVISMNSSWNLLISFPHGCVGYYNICSHICFWFWGRKAKPVFANTEAEVSSCSKWNSCSGDASSIADRIWEIFIFLIFVIKSVLQLCFLYFSTSIAKNSFLSFDKIGFVSLIAECVILKIFFLLYLKYFPLVRIYLRFDSQVTIFHQKYG